MNIMNRTYKLVWNAAHRMWAVAGELAKGRKKTSGKCRIFTLLLASSLGTLSAHAAPAANALPTGESVASGSATFDRTVSNQLTVNQSTAKLITNWNSFDIGSNGKVIFAQPDAASIALNRVTTGSPTEIFGQLSANGQLVLVNPNGITFGAGSQTSAAAIVASSLDTLDSDFNAGNLIFTRGATAGTVQNAGSIQAKHIILLSPDINNSGSISAVDGNIALINADQVNGSTQAVVQLSTVAGVIKNSGTLQATKVTAGNGLVILFGDISQSSSHVDMSGTISGADTNTVQGFNVNVSNELALANTTSLTALGSININADVNMSGSGGLALTSLGGYNLNYGAKVNLAPVAPAFTVNGTPYTVINDVNQLQAMSLNLIGNYVLANDIDASSTASWNVGQGFMPVGDTTNGFSGKIEGLGHAVNALSIQRPAMDYVGLIGYTLGSSIRHLGITNATIVGGNSTGGLVGAYGNGGITPIVLQANWVTGSVKGLDNVGGLLGQLSNSFTTSTLLNRNYVNAIVQGNNNIGGLIGNTSIILLLSPNPSSVTISNNYVANSVQGVSGTGGLIGNNLLNELIGNTSVYSIKDNLITAGVTGNNNTGGLIGNNNAIGSGFGVNTFKVNQNYVSGPVSSITTTGGLIGQSNISFGFSAPLNNNFWNTETTGQFFGIGAQTGLPVLTGYAGINSTQAMQLATFASWGADIDATAGSGSTWRIYDGLSGPLLRSFLKPLTVSADLSKTYDGTTFGSPTLSYSRSTVDLGKILGTAIVSGTGIGARNAGSYSLDVTGGLYSTDQFGYDIAFASGTLNINAANLTITSADVVKTYDATTSANGSAVVGSGSLFGTDSLSGGSFAFADKNAGTGKTVTVSGVTVNDGNGGNNYNISYADNTSSTINKRLLTLTATDASKVYDGKLTSADRPLITGRQRGDSIVGLTQSYLDKNAGTGKTINVDAGFTIRDGNNGDNYTVMVVDSHNGVITPKALTISTVANTKVYDGGITSANKPLLTGLLSGDRVTGLFQQYESKTVGTGKKLLVKAGYVVQDGNGGGNYSVTEQSSTDGVITVN